jgi:hypothetical protein
LLLKKVIMSGNIKNLSEGLKDSEYKGGGLVNWPPVPYVPPADLHEKRETKQIKVKLPDGTSYFMSTYWAGNNEDYTNHVISMLCFLEQKETKNNVSKAFKVVKEFKDQLKPLTTALLSDASKLEKEECKLQLSHNKQALQNSKKEAIAEIMKAYKLICNYFVVKA